jgi:hypothetical protein
MRPTEQLHRSAFFLPVSGSKHNSSDNKSIPEHDKSIPEHDKSIPEHDKDMTRVYLNMNQRLEGILK